MSDAAASVLSDIDGAGATAAAERRYGFSVEMVIPLDNISIPVSAYTQVKLLSNRG